MHSDEPLAQESGWCTCACPHPVVNDLINLWLTRPVQHVTHQQNVNAAKRQGQAVETSVKRVYCIAESCIHRHCLSTPIFHTLVLPHSPPIASPSGPREEQMQQATPDFVTIRTNICSTLLLQMVLQQTRLRVAVVRRMLPSWTTKQKTSIVSWFNLFVEILRCWIGTTCIRLHM